jgi:hypothetical protein
MCPGAEKCLRWGGPRRAPDPQQRWLTFVRNHATVIVACDFFAVVTATFRTLCVFVIMDVGTRRILHHNVTAHPSAEWTLQQFREALPDDHSYQFLIRDRDSIFSKELDQAVKDMGVRVLRTPRRKPASRVPGLLDPTQRTPPEDDPEALDGALQPRPATLLIRSGLPGTHPRERSGQRSQTQAARRLARCEDVRAWRLAS